MSGGKFKPGNPGKPKGAKNKPKPDMVAMQHIYEDTIGSFKHGMFYVYAHYYGYSCFYIGKGTGHRAWERTATCRTAEWFKYVCDIWEDGEDFEVRIIAAGLEEQEALAIERELIRIRKPSMNVIYNDASPQMRISL